MQHGQLKISSIMIGHDTLDKFKDVTQLEREVFLDNEKACYESLLDDREVEINDLKLNGVSLLESWLVDKSKIVEFFSIKQQDIEKKDW